MWRSRALFVFLRVAAVAAACFGIQELCLVPFRGNLVLLDVETRSLQAQSLSDGRATELAHANLYDLNQVADSRRLEPAWYLLYGTNCEILGRWSDAAQTYTAALRIDQRPEIYENRGMVMLRQGRVDQAVSDLATAARFDPGVEEQLDGELRRRVTEAASHR